MLVHAYKYESARTFALLAVMLASACRVGGVIGADLGGLGRDKGYPVLDLPVKGPQGRSLRVVLPPFAVHAIERYLDDERGREGGPLFRTRTGRRLDQPAIFRLVRRVAKAARIASHADLSSHGLRHSVATLLLDQGVALHVVQDLLGHADPRTTRLYDDKRHRLNRSPAGRLDTLLADGLADLFAQA